MAATFVETGGPSGTKDPEEFATYLNSCYGDPNTEKRALRRLHQLKQGEKESFAAFLPRFEKELAEAGGANWTSSVQINYLTGSLNGEMTDRLVGQLGLPKEYQPFVLSLQELGSNLDGARSQLQRKEHSWRKDSQQKGKSDQYQQGKKEGRNTRPGSPDAMDWESTKVSRAANRANESLKGKRAKWVDQEEIDRRKKERRCFRCGRSGCTIKECPLKPAQRPVQVKRGKPAPIVTEAAVEDSDTDTLTGPDQDEIESEKE